MRGEVEKKNTQMRSAVSIKRRVAIALWHLATNGDCQSIGHMFGLAKGTVCVIVNEICLAIEKVILKRHVKLPASNQIEEIVNGLETKFVTSCTCYATRPNVLFQFFIIDEAFMWLNTNIYHVPHIMPVTILPYTCSPPQRSGPKYLPVLPLHNT